MSDWLHRAECRKPSVDPELFFPVSEKPADPTVAAARRVCAACPVREKCLEWALVALTHGIAGGLTTDERRAVREERNTAAQLETIGGAR